MRCKRTEISVGSQPTAERRRDRENASVKIEVDDDILTVSGAHEEKKEEKDKDFLRRERRYGSFTRSMALPAGVDAKKIKAKTHDGVVEVTIPLPKDTKKEAVTITPTAG